MSDMRLIVMGAGGRMGRTLVRTIAETAGVVVAGAVEQAGSPVLGQDCGVLAGVGANGVAVGADLAALTAKADGILDFTVPAASLATAEVAAKAGLVHILGTTGFAPDGEARIAAAARTGTIVPAAAGASSTRHGRTHPDRRAVLNSWLEVLAPYLSDYEPAPGSPLQ